MQEMKKNPTNIFQKLIYYMQKYPLHYSISACLITQNKHLKMNGHFHKTSTSVFKILTFGKVLYCYMLVLYPQVREYTLQQYKTNFKENYYMLRIINF